MLQKKGSFKREALGGCPKKRLVLKREAKKTRHGDPNNVTRLCKQFGSTRWHGRAGGHGRDSPKPRDALSGEGLGRSNQGLSRLGQQPFGSMGVSPKAFVVDALP